MNALSEVEFREIVRAGILAPSADNRHRLKFELFDEGIRLWCTSDFLSAGLQQRVLALISFGAVAENIKIRATRYGFDCLTTWFPDPSRPDLLAEICPGKAGRPLDELDPVIESRHTNRRFYQRSSMAEADRQRINAEVAKVPDVNLLWLDDVGLRKKALRLIRIAETERFRSRELHHELFSAIRFEAGWRTPTPEGLAPGALEIEKPLQRLFGLLRHWPVMRALQFIGAHKLIGVRASTIPCLTAPHLCALVTSLNLTEGSISTGAALERLWLGANQIGLAFQPFAASALYALKLNTEVQTALNQQLRAGWQEIAGDNAVMMIARLGHAKEPSLRSSRHPVEHYLK